LKKSKKKRNKMWSKHLKLNPFKKNIHTTITTITITKKPYENKSQ